MQVSNKLPREKQEVNCVYYCSACECTIFHTIILAWNEEQRYSSVKTRGTEWCYKVAAPENFSNSTTVKQSMKTAFSANFRSKQLENFSVPQTDYLLAPNVYLNSQHKLDKRRLNWMNAVELSMKTGEVSNYVWTRAAHKRNESHFGPKILFNALTILENFKFLILGNPRIRKKKIANFFCTESFSKAIS